MNRLHLSLAIIIISSILSSCSIKKDEISQEVSQAIGVEESQPTSTTKSNTTMIQRKPAAELLNLSATQKKLQATFQTSMGDIEVELFHEKAPETVANFVGLAEGTQSWLDPKSGNEIVDKPLYQNVIFHRVIKGFMIQGGDPLGIGIGGPGYKFQDEIDPTLTFDKPGLLAMANAGPGTNGSQFFITEIPTPHLNGKHTIFGRVTKGMDIMLKIANTPTGAQDKPQQDVVIKNIVITRS